MQNFYWSQFLKTGMPSSTISLSSDAHCRLLLGNKSTVVEAWTQFTVTPPSNRMSQHVTCVYLSFSSQVTLLQQEEYCGLQGPQPLFQSPHFPHLFSHKTTKASLQIDVFQLVSRHFSPLLCWMHLNTVLVSLEKKIWFCYVAIT